MATPQARPTPITFTKMKEEARPSQVMRKVSFLLVWVG